PKKAVTPPSSRDSLPLPCIYIVELREKNIQSGIVCYQEFLSSSHITTAHLPRWEAVHRFPVKPSASMSSSVLYVIDVPDDGNSSFFLMDLRRLLVASSVSFGLSS
ncbi:hypothetical protein V2J09_021608, partial [Rumex salicifolius]